MNRSRNAALYALFLLLCAPLSCGTSSRDDGEPTDSTGGSTASATDQGTGGSSGPGTASTPSGGSGPGTAATPTGGSGPGTTTTPSGGSGPGTTITPSGGSGPATTAAPTGGSGPGTTTTPSGGSDPGTTTTPSGGSDPGTGSADGSADPGTTTLRAVIIKSALPLRDPNGPDTQTNATTEPYNTHVFADVLAQHLTELGVAVEVVEVVDCSDLSCIHPDASSTAHIVVFAGATYSASMPQDLADLSPTLQTASPAPVVTSALTSCGAGQGDALPPFMQTLTATGIPTVPGVWLQATSGTTLTDEEMHSKLLAFAQSLVDAT